MKKLFRSQQVRLSRWLSSSAASRIPSNRSARRSLKQQSPLLFVVSVAALTSVIGHRFYNEPQLTIGTVAPETIKAPESAQAADPIATAAAREAAFRNAVSVYMVNPSQTAAIQADLDSYLADIQKFRESTGDFPYTSIKTLSPGVQHFLRQQNTGDFQTLLKQINATTPTSTAWLKTKDAQAAIKALRTYRAKEKMGLNGLP